VIEENWRSGDKIRFAVIDTGIQIRDKIKFLKRSHKKTAHNQEIWWNRFGSTISNKLIGFNG
jgi:hypothetical protein